MSEPKTNKKRRWNWVLSDYIRKAFKRYYEFSARLKGQTFYCEVLHGHAEYNLTINSDSTVSCNCQDYDGSGHIGDLNKNTFEEVFFGPVAQDLRKTLAKGKIPLAACTRCSGLKRIARSKIPKDFWDGKEKLQKGPPPSTPHDGSDWPAPRLPYRGMLLENTVNCNIDCLGCDRGSAALIRKQRFMPLEQITKMADLVRNLGLQQLFYLNLGEPFLSPNVGPELSVIRQKNPDCRIVISSNAIILNTDAKREAALYATHIFFSVAGINDEMLEKYEKRGSFEKAYANMKALVEFRNARGLTAPIIEWKYLLFNWNDKHETLEKAIEMAKAIGVDYISFWPTNNPIYGSSWRYRLGKLDDIGETSWKGREVDLRKYRKIIELVPA
ncbi:radical SAM/SPASM domain-containing protein [Pedosphaera parvula]|uniref:Radical SAM domain protein n=1 Tax=Pedosphaera parvula (strain Ellin514) TaxID=320771 RepID=B9XRX4_PEDPL|nr:radical SAM/SPASM domain-containing protein [Pedosphaera parvula]EEF57433.1 Radical SAM domain protein [Pedosphaera parvula Ellin514]